MYDNYDALALFRYCGKKKLPVTLHLQTPIDLGIKYPRSSYWFGGGYDTLERVLKKCPDTIFFGHAQAFWAGISDDQQGLTAEYPSGAVKPGGKLPVLLRTYPNLYCDMSATSGLTAFKRDPVFAKEFLDEFQTRVLYARDSFHNQHQDLISSLGLSQQILDRIYFQNASDLLRGDLT